MPHTTGSPIVQLTDIPTHAADVVSRLIDGEAVLVHPGQGVVRVLNQVGATLWELTDGQRSAAELADALVAEYDVDPARAQADVLAFLADLADRGVIDLTP